MKKSVKMLFLAMTATVMMTAPMTVRADGSADPVELNENKQYTDENGIVYTFTVSGNAATLSSIDLTNADEYDVIVPGAVLPEGGDTSVSVKTIGRSVFSNKTEITSIDLSNTQVTSFRNYGFGKTAFEGCTGMESIKLPETLTGITNYMFEGCSSLEMLELPKNVKTFGQGVAHTRILEGCTSLQDILVDNENASFKSVDGVLYDITGTTLYAYPPAKQDETFAVPENVTKIFPGAFQTVQNLRRVRFPAGLAEIGQYAFCGNFAGPSEDNSLEEAWFYGDKSKIKLGASPFLEKVTRIQKAVRINMDNITSECRNTVSLNAEVFPEGADQGLVWSIDRSDIAELSSSGTLVPKAAGTVTVTATSTDTKWDEKEQAVTAAKQITIVPYVSEVSVTGDKTEVVEGNEATFTAHVAPEGVKDSEVTWSVNEPTLARIDENGILTAVKAGTVTVIATNKDGDPNVNEGIVEGRCQITIKEKAKPVPTATPIPTATPVPTTPAVPTPTTAPTPEATVTPVPEKTQAAVQLVKTSENQIKIKWKKDAAAKKGYRIYVKGGKSKRWTKVTDVSAGKTSYVLKKLKGQKLQSGTVYQFRVVSLTKSKNKEGKMVSLKTSTAPSKPALKASASKRGTLKLAWKKIKGASGYEIQLKTSKKASYQTVKVLGKKAVSYTQKKLGKIQKVYVRVRAFNTVNGTRIYGGWTTKAVKAK